MGNNSLRTSEMDPEVFYLGSFNGRSPRVFGPAGLWKPKLGAALRCHHLNFYGWSLGSGSKRALVATAPDAHAPLAAEVRRVPGRRGCVQEEARLQGPAGGCWYLLLQPDAQRFYGAASVWETHYVFQ